MLAYDVAQYLSSLGLGTVGTNIFVDFLPDVDNAIAVYSTGGFQSNAKLSIDFPTIQIYVRNTSVQNAYDAIASVYDKLHGLNNVTLPQGTHIANCVGLQSAPNNIGLDDKQRQRYTINFRFTIANKTTHRE